MKQRYQKLCSATLRTKVDTSWSAMCAWYKMHCNLLLDLHFLCFNWWSGSMIENRFAKFCQLVNYFNVSFVSWWWRYTDECNTVIMNITLCTCVPPLSNLVSMVKGQIQCAQLCNQSKLLIVSYQDTNLCVAGKTINNNNKQQTECNNCCNKQKIEKRSCANTVTILYWITEVGTCIQASRKKVLGWYK